MSSSISLIQNENMKIYRRPRTWIMFLILIGALILMTVLFKTFDTKPTATQDWKTQVELSIKEDQQSLTSLPKEMGQDTIAKITNNIENRIKISEYRLEHNLNPYENTLWSSMNNMAMLTSLVTLLTIIVAADMIAAEFSWGTIKLLLIRPATRTKILINKYIATLLFSLVLLIVMFITSFLLGAITEGFTGLSQVDLYIGSDGLVHERSMVLQVLKTYGFQIVSLIMYVTLSFMISSAFRSSAMAIAFSLGLMLVGNTIVGLFSGYNWVKYTLFANLDLTQYFGGLEPLRPDMTLGFSIIMLVAYFIVFHLVSWLLFIKRDVAG
ncbi:ABC transporter permease [Paenibacillus albiflavus]|uniref:ABC transporter permease n=1 Tax=Paenibacillus albiflavus TaxID=2545760 RepID=A0A4R4EFR3_9BACL|nr:ABC transporter permease [Paenibacillus albiflavus]TCZ78904.1 ABC transporter permease [Paenibacillus albiflavus]